MNLDELDSRENVKVDAFDRKVIYVYRHIGVEKHEGWLKVGETHASKIKGDGTNMRILDQNTAANIEYEVLYTTNAVRNNGTVFSDHDIHELLEAEDIEREETINPLTNKKSEWFKTDIETVKNLIEKYKMLAVEDKKGKITDFKLRDEQNEAVAITADYYDACQNDTNIEPSFLWNAKPRFGKTLTAYCFASTIQAKKVLIVTNRPAIADSWYTDFNKFDFADENQNDGKFRWIFTTSEAVKQRLNQPNIYTGDDQVNNLFLRESNTVHFISLQDIKGLEKDDNNENAIAFKAKNKWLFDLDWDLLIIDESHEGVDTSRAFRVFDNIKTKFTLHLSGTPFKALASNKFNSKQIYNWSYTDEQQAKENWPIVDGPNPYAELPKMNIFTYKLSSALEITAEEAKQEENEYAFDLNEFFLVATIDGKDKFVHEDKVKLFIKNLANPKYQYPFSSDKYRESLRHTFWLLPRVKACEQMKKLLLEDDYFKANYAPEDIIVAAGDGDDDRKARTALDEVRKRIGEPGTAKHPLETRTITLSCGQLTTGVTIPAWTAVLMLNNCKSPAQYMQAAFRAQNPFKAPTSGGECITKENCFVFDFAPDRILQTLAEMADSINHGGVTHTREEKVRILINFLPVIAEDDEGKMKYLDANEVLTIPLKLITEEVINRGFMSNRLFENISGIFGCPQSIKDIIAKLNEADDPTGKKPKPPIKPQVKIWIDNDNKIHINEDIVVNTTNGLFGEKRYVEIGSDEGREVQDTIAEAVAQARDNNYDGESIKAVQKAITKKMPKLVAKIPDPAPKPGDPDYHDKEQPDEKPKPKEKSEEEKVRDRLRGFARTIPSFLMAYGTKDTKLSNFGDNIPEDVFEELTNITKDEFKKLRDGFDYEKEEEDGTKSPAHFPGLFNESVFNSSVQAFEEKQKQLACYYTSDSEEDIFEYIPPQANNQIFTPKRVVRMMIDMLEKENPGIFNSTTNTFIDLYMKSGMYITEIVRRIFDQTRDQYPSDTACITHILENQVYGFAPSPILDAITKNYIFGFDDDMVISQEHFKEYDTIPAAKDGTLKQEINKIFNPQGGDMKFTAVVGNPPYQETVGKTATQTQSNTNWIYPFFQENADIIAEKTCLIYPFGGWFDAPERLNGLGQKILNDGHTISITAYEGTTDKRAWYRTDRKPTPIFGNNANLSAGVSIVLRDHSSHHQTYKYSNHIYTDETATINLDNAESLVPNPAFLNIANKIIGNKLYTRIKKGIFGIESNFVEQNPQKVSEKKEDWDNPIKLLTNDKSGSSGRTKVFWCDKNTIPKGHEYLNKHKVIMTSAYPKQKLTSGNPTIENVREREKIIIEMLEPSSAFGASRIALFMSDNKKECENFLKYTSTNFFISLCIQEPNKRSSFGFIIPDQDFTDNSDINWDNSIEEIDKQLFNKYNITAEEQKTLGII